MDPNAQFQLVRASPLRRFFAGVVFASGAILSAYLSIIYARPWFHAQSLGILWLFVGAFGVFASAGASMLLAYVHEDPPTAAQLVAEVLAEIRALEGFAEDP